MSSLPNVLTITRIGLVPLFVAAFFLPGEAGRWIVFVLFCLAGATDALDGIIARKFGAESSFGRMLDPIADKLIVSAALLMLAADGTLRGFHLVRIARVSCRRRRQPAGDKAREGQDHRAGRGDCGPDRLLGDRTHADGRHQRRAGRDVGRCRTHVLHRLRLFAGRAVARAGRPRAADTASPRRRLARRAPRTETGVKLLYFAWVRQKIGRSEEQLAVPPDVTTVASLMDFLRRRGAGYEAAFQNPALLRCAVNQEHARFDARVGPDDEVAFFPPVTGG